MLGGAAREQFIGIAHLTDDQIRERLEHEYKERPEEHQGKAATAHDTADSLLKRF